MADLSKIEIIKKKILNELKVIKDKFNHQNEKTKSKSKEKSNKMYLQPIQNKTKISTISVDKLSICYLMFDVQNARMKKGPTKILAKLIQLPKVFLVNVLWEDGA